MILDAQLLLSDAQAITADAGSSNVIDLGSAGRDVGQGEPLVLLVTVDVAADITTGDETYSINFQTDDNTSFSSPTTLQTNVVTAAQLAINKTLAFGLPLTGTERYVRAYYDVGGTTPTATLTALLQPFDMVQLAPKYYASGYTIS